MFRGKKFRRNERFKHIKRKDKITKFLGIEDGFKIKGKLNKGKVHCSCWMCRSSEKSIKEYKEKKEKIKARDEINDFFKE